MLYQTFKNKKLSRLGFGAMRLPLMEDGKRVDEAQVEAMVKYAMEHGVNYFDTAYPYHGGQSERVLGRVLQKYPREQFYLASKYPGHQVSDTYDPAGIFEEQLKNCKVEYFDFYLLHNVYENSIATYQDSRWGIIDYFVRQKELGRIKHLGFSSHGGVELLNEFLDYCRGRMEFCQIQLNYLDWTLQDAKAKYELLEKRGIPVWVMEPVRGGRLAQLEAADVEKFRSLRPEESVAAWAFRWLQGLPNVTVVLSGMSDMEQMVDNVKTFSDERPLSAEEEKLVFTIAEGMKNSLPCTGCRYCCDGCPQGLDIPMLISVYNELRFSEQFTVTMRLDALPEEKRSSACVACGACAQVCPQGIDIPAAMRELTDKVASLPSWAEICRQREEEQRKNNIS